MLKIGDRISESGYTGTIIGIVSEKKVRVLYDATPSSPSGFQLTISNIFLTKLYQSKDSKIKTTYWK